jgi:magnesium-transporting ATPase (P-type)
MARPPHPTDEPLLTGFVIWRTAFVGVLLLSGGLFMVEQAREATSLEYARTMAVNALVMGQIFYLVSARFFFKPSWTLDGLFGNPVAVLAIAICVLLQLAFTHLPPMQHLFGTAALDASAWLHCIAVGVAVFVVVEIEKLIVRLRHPGRVALSGGRA